MFTTLGHLRLPSMLFATQWLEDHIVHHQAIKLNNSSFIAVFAALIACHFARGVRYGRWKLEFSDEKLVACEFAGLLVATAVGPTFPQSILAFAAARVMTEGGFDWMYLKLKGRAKRYNLGFFLFNKMCFLLQCVGGATATTAAYLDSRTLDLGFTVAMAGLVMQISSVALVLRLNGDLSKGKNGSRRTSGSVERCWDLYRSCTAAWLIAGSLAILRPVYRLLEARENEERGLTGNEGLLVVVGPPVVVLAGLSSMATLYDLNLI